MPTYPVTNPDGSVVHIDAATPDEALAKGQKQYKGATPTPAAGKIPQQQPMEMGGPTASNAMTLAGSLATGMGDQLVGGRQLYSKLFQSPEKQQEVTSTIKQREEEVRRQGVNPLGRAAGSMLMSVPLAAAGPFGGVAGSALGGAAGSLLQPITRDHYWTEKTKDALIGAALGAPLGAVGATMAPRMTADKAMMMKEGVKLTPGELYSGARGIARRAEEAFKSWPILGSFIAGAERRSRESFNIAYLNQTLDFVGQKLNPKTAAGYAAIEDARTKFGTIYDTVYNKVQNFQVDQQLANELQATRLLSKELGGDQEKALTAVITNRLGPVMSGMLPIGKPPGPLLRQADTALRNIANSARREGKEGYAQRIEDLRESVTDAIIRQNPVMKDELTALKTGYSMFARARDAAVRRPKSDGVFTPNDLAASIKGADRKAGRWRFSEGDALGQEFAQAAERVIGSHMPNSGTPERQMFMKPAELFLEAGGGAGLGTTAAMHPETIPYMVKAALATGVASAPYTRPGMAGLNWLAANRYTTPIGKGLRGVSAPAGAAGQDIIYGGPQQ